MTTEYLGVSWSEPHGRWRAAVTIEGVERHLGFYDDDRRAAEAYDRAIRKAGLDLPTNFDKQKVALGKTC